MRILLPFGIGLAIAAGACVAATRSGDTRQAPTPAEAAASLDPSKGPDRQMLDFGEAHPECRMWTNWEKLCSRTGPAGSVQCNVDPDQRVEPSTPFCASNPLALRPGIDPQQLSSSERFCVAARAFERISTDLRPA
jgi:hypothetical protein